MNTKTLIALGVIIGLGATAFILYKKHPEWFGVKPAQPAPAPVVVSPHDSLADRINAGAGALSTVSDTIGDWLH